MKLTAAVLLFLALTAAPAAADQGRALLPTGARMPVHTPDAKGAEHAVALPDGGAVLFSWEGPNRGIAGVRMRADGTRDRSFNARIRLAKRTLLPVGALRRPDGRLVVTATKLANHRLGYDELVVAQLLPDGALDPSFGSGGIARTRVAGPAGAALAPDGTLVVTGSDAAQKHWAAARLGATGAVERVARVPGSRVNDYGVAVRVAADGRSTVLGGRGRHALVARLLPDLTADPAFNGGALSGAPVNPFDLALAPGGAVTILGPTRLARLKPDGTRDTAYGRVRLGLAEFGRILAQPDGDVLVYRTPAPEARPPHLPDLVIARVSASGERTTVARHFGFGGGGSTRSMLRTKGLLRQTGFAAGDIVQRPDGSYLVTGGVSLVQLTGEGEGTSSARDAVAALTPQLNVDRSFGPAFPEASIAMRPLGRGDHGFTFRLRVRASGPGLLSVKVRDRRGRLLAAGIAPVHKAGYSTVRVASTRRHGQVRAYVARFRDLAGRTAGVAATP